MNILLIGSGGREHCLAWKISQSESLGQLFVWPGNAGTGQLATNIELTPGNFESIAKFCLTNHVDMVVVGPEEPLVMGIHDFFHTNDMLRHIPVIGPEKKGALLEGSKEFAKQFMIRHQIPTARFLSVNKNNLSEGIEFLKTLKPSYVLKADGLAAGKGVIILENLDETLLELEKMLEGKFGQASQTVVIEEFLKGIELSAFVITDGNSYLMLPEAKDYKRIGIGDTGLNTGGMGAVSPVPFASSEFMLKVELDIVKPTIEGLKKDQIPYRGFIFFGIMNVSGNPYLIEYNVRMGDPETEVVFPRIENDILELFMAVSNQTIGQQKLVVKAETCATVVMVSGGYPENYKKGYEIMNLEKTNGSMIFHSGTRMDNGNLVTSGGRVFAVSSFGNNLKEALDKSYKNAEIIDFQDKYYRNDIGFDL